MQEHADSVLDLTPASVARAKNNYGLGSASRDKMVRGECSTSKWDYYRWSLRLIGIHGGCPAHQCQDSDPHPVIHERTAKVSGDVRRVQKEIRRSKT